MDGVKATCALCGDPMPPGEEMFKFHGYSGDCPKPPLPAAPADEPAAMPPEMPEIQVGDKVEYTRIVPMAWAIRDEHSLRAVRAHGGVDLLSIMRNGVVIWRRTDRRTLETMTAERDILRAELSRVNLVLQQCEQTSAGRQVHDYNKGPHHWPMEPLRLDERAASTLLETARADEAERERDALALALSKRDRDVDEADGWLTAARAELAALRAAPTPPEWCNAESVKPRDGDDPFVWNDHDAESPVAPSVSPTRLKLGLAYAAGWDARSEHPEGELYGPDEPFDTLQRQWVDAALASPVGETPEGK